MSVDPPELYPTEVRGVGLGFSAYIGGIGICLIPLINYLVREMKKEVIMNGPNFSSVLVSRVRGQLH